MNSHTEKQTKEYYQWVSVKDRLPTKTDCYCVKWDIDFGGAILGACMWDFDTPGVFDVSDLDDADKQNPRGAQPDYWLEKLELPTQQDLYMGNGHKDSEGQFVQCSNVTDQIGLSKTLLLIFSQIEIWYGDIDKKETGRQLLERLQKQFIFPSHPEGQVKQDSPEEIVEESFKGLNDLIDDPDLVIWYKALIVTCMEEYAAQSGSVEEQGKGKQ